MKTTSEWKRIKADVKRRIDEIMAERGLE